MKHRNTFKPGRPGTLQIKPGARCTRGDRYSLNVRFAAVLALSKGANKKELAALLGCTATNLSKWQRETPQEVVNWWKGLGRGETPRDCPGCCPETALKGRRAAVCLLCNGASYAEITKITGIDRRRLWGYLKEDAAGLCISKATARRAEIDRQKATGGNHPRPKVTPAGLLRGKPQLEPETLNPGQDAPALV